MAKAVKAEIPCVDDPVSKLEDIGEKTQKKLLDIQAAAESSGVHDLVFPDRSIATGMGPMAYTAEKCDIRDTHAAVILIVMLHIVTICLLALSSAAKMNLCLGVNFVSSIILAVLLLTVCLHLT